MSSPSTLAILVACRGPSIGPGRALSESWSPLVASAERTANHREPPGKVTINAVQEQIRPTPTELGIGPSGSFAARPNGPCAAFLSLRREREHPVKRMKTRGENYERRILTPIELSNKKMAMAGDLGSS